MSSAFGSIMQHGYIVPDVEKAAYQWAERAGAGPFYVLDHLKMDQYYYRGVRSDAEICLAFGYWGPIQIELIKPLGDAETLYHDALRTGAGVLNHCASVVNDVDHLLASKQLEDRVIQRGTMPSGLKFVYLDKYLPDGSHLELIQATDSALAGFTGMQAVHERWSGDKPVRSIADLGADLAALRG